MTPDPQTPSREDLLDDLETKEAVIRHLASITGKLHEAAVSNYVVAGQYRREGQKFLADLNVLARRCKALDCVMAAVKNLFDKPFWQDCVSPGVVFDSLLAIRDAYSKAAKPEEPKP